MHRSAWMMFLVMGALGCGRENQPSAPAGQTAPCCEIDRTQLTALLTQANPPSGDWPMFGGTPERNMANVIDKDVVTEWSIEEGKRKNIKWVANLGTKAYGGPVVADGKIFVGTNNANPRDPKVTSQRAVLMAFSEADGKFLWQILHDYPADPLYKEASAFGLFSTPVVDGQRLYYVTPGCEVICAGTDGKVQWRLDMTQELKVVPFHTANCSPLVAGDMLVLITGNGVSEQTGKVVAPTAPSFLAVNKNTGKVVWQSALPGANIIEGQWSNPTLVKVGGKHQAIFAGGDNYLYGLEAETGKLIWKFNCQPERPGNDEREFVNYIIATPVAYDNKVYVGMGVYPEHASGPPYSHLLCVDVTRTGDVSAKSLNHKDAKNAGSGLVWSYGGKIDPVPKKGRRVYMGRTFSTCAIHDGLVYICEEIGYLHCLDAKTGQKYWEHDFKTGLSSSAYYVDGKVYVGTDDGEVIIFKHGKTRDIVAKNDLGEAIQSTPVVARGVLYVMTKSKLYAIFGK